MKKNILEEIKKHDTIIVHRHVRPDPDAYGSQGGMAEIIKSSFPDKTVYVVGKEEPSLSFLMSLDNIEDGEFENALAIICDTANKERICDQRYALAKTVIKLDHHPNQDPYGDLLWVDTTASSASEMVYEWYTSEKENGLVLSDKAARLIYAGIVGDTGRFLFPSTSQRTFDVAGELIRYDFDRTDLYNQMYEMKPHVAKLQGYVLQNYEMTSDGAAFIKLPLPVLKEYNVEPTEASQLVGSLGNLAGMKAWCFFIEEEDQIRVRLRSKGPIINELASQYNGGGHPLASGASVYSWEEAEEVKEKLMQICEDSR
ncbi:DHH family phosphoesterase [Mangrovibacillus cuniculi]|uniref:Bifunctional oligoribonuclease/PAP phosphatase NrnA n=1 Tax=Mangrovibacillus cuniculi TaxID=2593652 RepID=A0A7S8CC99_9BACI|nr:bifunctional oligoribonuclease/PAP phosphatase NrnA [Mangrovibacillus cuniculi]QPC47216.1 bifunctional oligoribonuclease/PAP phosphatase NrnA [Mangrovibacillus cuniculi]